MVAATPAGMVWIYGRANFDLLRKRIRHAA
jgi:hypothetical protein